MSSPFEIPSIPDHTLLRPIGKGSYGEVWLARTVFGVWRAVKVVYRSSFDRERPYEREFLGIQRYEPISRLHEGLVQILHAGRNDQAGYFYYSMELADALPSRRRPASDRTGDPVLNSAPIDPDHYQPGTLRGRLSQQARLPVSECVSLARQLAGALGYLHENGLVHRDIKPSNIIFVAGRAKLADLGLISGISESMSYVGTEGFVPPEGPGTVAADLFGLGMVLYQAATGLSHEDFPNVPDDWLGANSPPGALEFHEISLRACETAAKRRYQSAAGMDADLAQLQRGISLRQLRRIEKRMIWFRRAAFAGGVTAALALAGFATASWRARANREYFLRSDKLRMRAESAEKATREEFYNLLVMQARAEMLSGRPGRRTKSLAAIAEAAKSKPHDLDLRNLAIAALAFPDTEEIARYPLPMGTLSPPAYSLNFDTGCERFGYSDGRGTIHVCRVADGREIAATAGSLVGASSPDGSRMLIGSSLADWKVFEPSTGRSWVLPNEDRLSGLLGIHPDGRSAYIARRNGVKIFDFERGEYTGDAPDYMAAERYDYSLDGKIVAACSEGGHQLSLFTGSGKAVRTMTWPANTATWDLSASPDGRWAAVSLRDFTVRVCPADASTPPWVLAGHHAEVAAAAWDLPHQRLITSSWDGTTRWWSLANGQQELVENTWGSPLAVSFDGTRMARLAHLGAQGPGVIVQRIWGGEVWRMVGEGRPDGDADQRKGPWSVNFSPSGRYCATASFDGVRVWLVENWAPRAFISLGRTLSAYWGAGDADLFTSGAGGVQQWRLADTGMEVYPVATLSPDSSALRAISLGAASHQAAMFPAGICLIEPGRSRMLAAGAYDYLSTDPGGRWLAAMPRNGSEAVLIDLKNSGTVRRIPAPLPGGAAFSADGTLAYFSSSVAVFAVRLDGGEEVWRLPAHELGAGGPVVVDARGEMLAASIRPREISLINRADGAVLASLQAPEPEPLSALAFSPDGSLLLGSTTSHVIHVWNLREIHRELAALNLDWGPP